MRLALLLAAVLCLSADVAQGVFECSQDDDNEFKQCLQARVRPTQPSPLTGITKIHVINLERRSDRWSKFMQGPLKAQDVNRFSAVDKMDLLRTPPITRLFEKSDYNYRRGIVACALSHYSLWRHIASTEGEMHMVLEDDATFQGNFVSMWNTRFAYALPLDTQLLYLGGLLTPNSQSYKRGTVLQSVNRAFNRHLFTPYFSHDFFPDADVPLVNGQSRRFFYTAIAYALSSQAARTMVHIIDSMGFRRGADHMLYRLMDRYEQSYATNPLLVFPAPHSTDIQSDQEPVPLPNRPSVLSNIKREVVATNELGPLGAVPTFVVNLERSPDRLEHFAIQARQANVQATHFAAVDGSKLDMIGLMKQGVLTTQYPVNWRGSAGCALSHFMLYEQMLVTNHTHYLIFEDDAFLAPDFLNRVRDAIAIVPADWDILNFGCFSWSCKGTTVVGNIMAADTDCVSGTSAYLVTRRGAKTMLDICLPMSENIDKQSRPHYGSRLKFYCTTPALSEQNWDLRPDRTAHDRLP